MEEKTEKSTEEVNIFKEILEWSFCIFFALVIALVTRYYIIAPTVVKQESMVPTLQENQRLLLNRTKRITKKAYERGNIVTFEAPDKIIEAEDINLQNPVAKYSYKPENIWEKLIYNILELNKISYIKRIVAVGGDRIQILDGKVYLNGEELEESYLAEGTITKPAIYNDITVPEGYVYVMGDNRENSADSRTFGCIPVERLEGKVALRYWPFSKFSSIK